MVAEIDKIMDYADEYWDTDYAIGAQRFADKLQDAINSLEVKEVDLDAEIKQYFKGWANDSLHCFAMMQDGTSVGVDECIDIAKHFFELGLKAQEGE